MREGEWLAHIYRRSAGLPERVLVGPGDDCAVLAAAPGPMLLKVDQLVEGRHFRPGTPIELIGRKAVARAVSDVAAMGGVPTAALAAATLPRGFEHALALFDAMSRWALRFGCPLVGGDICTLAADQPGPLTLGVSVVGVPHATRGPVLRSGARPGDVVYVTGVLGGSFERATGLGRHLTFEPRLAEAAWLCDELGDRLHAMMDLSDGLGRDAGRLAEASGVGIHLEASELPAAAGSAWSEAASDGEDYELLFTADPSARVPERVPLVGTRVTRVGIVTPGLGCTIRTPGGDILDAREMGWEHV